ncbi:MAG: CDP-diacylglycerol--serine O-phosphatidyltransferase [Myxococcota bacterium]
MKISLQKSLFILPNLFTLSSVFCGFYAVLVCSEHASQEDLFRASVLILFAMFFDTIDGRVARLTKTQSAIGVQLDSLADVISFGVAPAVLVYRWSLFASSELGIGACFLYVSCGTIRLARYNVLAMSDSGAPKQPSKYVFGLPIPAAAGILISLVVASRHTLGSRLSEYIYLMLGVVFVLSFLMVSTIRFRSFKELRLCRSTALLITLVVGSATFIAWRFHASFAVIWLLSGYIAFALFESLVELSRRGNRREAETTISSR